MEQRIYNAAVAVVLTVLLFLSYQPSNAQSSEAATEEPRKQRIISPYSLTVRGGLTQFFGELNSQDMKFMVGASLRNQYTPAFAMSLDFTAGKLGGDKLDFFNSYFVTEYNTIELLAHWDLTEQFNRSNDSKNMHLGVYGGLGMIYFSANAFDLNTNQLVRFSNSEVSGRNPLFLRWGNPKGPLGVQRTHERLIPLGIEFNYALTRTLQLGLDYRFNFVRNDKLDATSGRRLINPEESNSYSDTPNDKFSFLTATITYRFYKKFRDADNDGISDEVDRCPDTPGMARFSGCPDTDNDGVPDYVDRCPTVAGSAGTSGCPDTDGDGIIDRLDECPTVAGTLNGCPDRDGDGVKDEFDGCPDVPGLFRFGGCPDTDGDGIPDQVDKCPDKPGRYEDAGCPKGTN